MTIRKKHKTAIPEGREQVLLVVGFQSYADINDARKETNAFLHVSFHSSAHQWNKQPALLLSSNRS